MVAACANTSLRNPAAAWARGTSRGRPRSACASSVSARARSPWRPERRAPDLNCLGMAVEPRPMTDAERWYRERFERTPQRDALFSTLSGEPVEPLYTPDDVGPFEERIGFPGEHPFTRGAPPSMSRGRLWTLRQFAGFGTAEETNERFRSLLGHGQTGLSTAFDMPSLL